MYHDFLILGGAGLVGLQVCRQIVLQLSPRRIVVASLLESEAVAACAR
jgi:FlaA1/EpsC-like NDP-sugar epimerase